MMQAKEALYFQTFHAKTTNLELSCLYFLLSKTAAESLSIPPPYLLFGFHEHLRLGSFE